MSASFPRVTRRGARVDWVKFDAELARDGCVDPVDKALYAAIASFVDQQTRESPESVVFDADGIPENIPTRKRLAKCIGRSVDTVDRATKRLEKRGLLRVHRMADPDNPRSMLPSEYELLDHHLWDQRAAERAAERTAREGGRMDAARGGRTGAARGGRMDAARGGRTGAAVKEEEEELREEKETHTPAVGDVPAAGPAPQSVCDEGTLPMFGDDAPPSGHRKPKDSAPDEPDGFDDFWQAYPRKVGKPAARKAYAAVVRQGAAPQALLEAVRAHAAAWERRRVEKRYIPHPTTWLNQGRYEDELDDTAPSGGGAGGHQPWQCPPAEDYHAGWGGWSQASA
ncbi:hypothetical protein F0L17_14680 [Streptomyces sp. TRM43335]|uniref:Helix-turn-helix domain-containing protein n=1 Tax=Streptomyces taklimakanensis TaxID=2569853 RepID=A0A6G2BDL0_9ACTN|nr:helix-turn-helix domain-containing protein [Streptomyces taklimakanensis]MTE20330.1 hypothetical protein [Streptomyces taklimakanensis]